MQNYAVSLYAEVCIRYVTTAEDVVGFLFSRDRSGRTIGKASPATGGVSQTAGKKKAQDMTMTDDLPTAARQQLALFLLNA